MPIQKMGKCKNLIRSARNKARNQTERVSKIERARRNHLKNALRSCGEAFAAQLKAYYQKTPATRKTG